MQECGQEGNLCCPSGSPCEVEGRVCATFNEVEGRVCTTCTRATFAPEYSPGSRLEQQCEGQNDDGDEDGDGVSPSVCCRCTASALQLGTHTYNNLQLVRIIFKIPGRLIPLGLQNTVHRPHAPLSQGTTCVSLSAPPNSKNPWKRMIFPGGTVTKTVPVTVCLPGVLQVHRQCFTARYPYV